MAAETSLEGLQSTLAKERDKNNELVQTQVGRRRLKTLCFILNCNDRPRNLWNCLFPGQTKA